MKNYLLVSTLTVSTLALALFIGLIGSAVAATRIVTLSVPSMYCEVCPITVRKALENVPGVSKSTVSFEKREATVTFDDAKTSINALKKATLAAGYESKLKEEISK